MTGRDVIIAALLGAEEFGFATAPLIALGCVMMRVCNLNTCPMGVATQDPKLRRNFKGKPEYVVNFMHFIAQEVREYMAELGFRSIDEMVGRTEVLLAKPERNWKNKNLNLAPLLYKPEVEPGTSQVCTTEQNHQLEKSLDCRELLAICKTAVAGKKQVDITLPIKNTDRVVGTILGSEITRLYGLEGLPEDTIRLHFKGSAGQSFGAFLPPGITLRLEGDANDHVGKGLSGGKIIIHPFAEAPFNPHENIIIGNVAFYGATAGQGFVNGLAGQRFGARNSGAELVVEGVGENGCEYMTGGEVLVLGEVGLNFAAGMSGGIAYVYDETKTLKSHCNLELVELACPNETDIARIRELLEAHVEATASPLGVMMLYQFDDIKTHFTKVIPIEYAKMLDLITEYEAQGHTHEEAQELAFEITKMGA